jgi:hypothetical protein
MAVTWKKLAFYDEVAVVSDEVAHDVGTTAAQGSAVDASRHDHIHRLGNGSVDAAAILAADVVNGDKIADDAVGSEHIEQLSAALDFGGQQAQDMKIHTVADATARLALTPLVGKLCWQTDELHPYVCTIAA